MFDSERLIKVRRNVEINVGGIHTDIDAAIFDEKTKCLALFQLKWQDKFSSDTRVRRSRISNFYPKANEWVGKMTDWVRQRNGNEILNALELKETELGEVYLFVLGRYNTHFSNQEIDQRAAWGSWYHIVELMHKIKADFDDPLRELYVKLKIDSPRNKTVPKELMKGYGMNFNNFSLTWSANG